MKWFFLIGITKQIEGHVMIRDMNRDWKEGEIIHMDSFRWLVKSVRTYEQMQPYADRMNDLWKEAFGF